MPEQQDESLSEHDQALLDWTKAASAEAVSEALAAGKLDSLLGRTSAPDFPSNNLEIS
jgi:hypothetical protein